MTIRSIHLVASLLFIACIILIATPSLAQFRDRTYNPILRIDPETGETILDEAGLAETLAALASPEPMTRHLALLALDDLRYSDVMESHVVEVIQALQSLLTDEDTEIALLAADMYAESAGIYSEPIADMFADPRPEIQAQAVWLVATNYMISDKYLEQVTNLLDSPDPYLASLAKLTIYISTDSVQVPDSETLKPIIDKGTPEQVKQVVSMLGSQDSQFYLEAAQHPRAIVRIAVLDLLWFVEDEIEHDVWLIGLQDENREVVQQTLYDLSSDENLPEDILEELYKCGLHQSNESIQAYVFHVLMAQKGQGYLNVIRLIAAGKHPEYWETDDISTEMELEGIQAIESELRDILIANEPIVGHISATLLGRLAGLKADTQKWLSEQLDNPDLGVRYNAIEAFRYCTSINDDNITKLKDIALSSNDWVCSWIAMQALTDYGCELDEEILKTLTHGLSDKRNAYKALDSIMTLPPEQAVELMFQGLDIATPETQRFILGALQNYPEQALQYTYKIYPLLNSETFTTVQAAAELLILLEPQQAAINLSAMLYSEEYTHQVLAVQLFHTFPELVEYGIDVLIGIVQEPDLARREGALTILGNAGVNAEAALDTLREEASKDGPDSVAEWALQCVESAVAASEDE